MAKNAPPRRGKRPMAGRNLRVRVKTAKGRSVSSKQWLERQLNDPYVVAAKTHGYRSRAAFKLAELDDRFGFLRRGARVLDLGAAPGGWTQGAVERAGAANVFAVDIAPMEEVAGAAFLQADFLQDDAPALIRTLIADRDQGASTLDVVLSDMAAPATGHRQTDHLKVMALAEAALDLALEILNPGGAFVAKVLRGGTEQELLAKMKKNFSSVRHVKPPASRSDSAEIYVVATGFRGAP